MVGSLDRKINEKYFYLGVTKLLSKKETFLHLCQNSDASFTLCWVACDHALSLYLCNLFSGGGHDWPKTIGQKCRHPLVVVDFSLHFCLHNEQ